LQGQYTIYKKQNEPYLLCILKQHAKKVTTSPDFSRERGHVVRDTVARNPALQKV